MMDWNFWQQVVRYVMAYVGTLLVGMGFPEDMVTAAVGGGVAAVGLAWWWFTFRNAKPETA